MADESGRPVDAMPALPEGLGRLTDGEARAVRALLAADKSPGKGETLAALGLPLEQDWGQVLDAVVLHGAPTALVDAVRANLLKRLSGFDDRRAPVPYERLFRRAAVAPNGRVLPLPSP